MSADLFLRLGSDADAPIHWLRAGRDGTVEAEGVSDDFGAIAEAARGCRVIGLVSGTDLLLTSVRVPTQSRQKLLRAIPYALEEQLAGDIDDAHFVLGSQHDGNWAVAVLQTTWVDRWLSLLDEHGLRPERLAPEILCLPEENDAWTVLVDKQGFQVRTGPQHGFGGDVENLEVLLEAAIEEHGEGRPAHLRVLADGVDPELPTDILGAEIMLEPTRAGTLLVRGWHDQAPLDLLTGRYAPVGQGRNLWRPWIPVAVLFAIWVCLDTGLALLEQRQLQNDIAAVESRAMVAYQDLFPGAGNLDQARARVENRLRQVGARGDSDQEDMLDTLRLVGPVLANGSGFRLQGLSYRGGVLELEIETDTLQRLDQLQQELDRTDRIGAEVRSARSEEDAVQGRMVVRRQGS